MTVIYTETSLLSDPIFHIEDQSASFTVAFSSLVIECRVHREENIRYLRESDLRTGDLIRLHGVFVSTGDRYYIRINSFSLVSGMVGKKRKVDDMSHQGNGMNISSSTSVSSSINGSSSRKPSLMSLVSVSPGIKKRPLASVGNLMEVDVEFSDYFFILYGKAYYVITKFNTALNALSRDQMNSPEYKPIIENTQEKIDVLTGMLWQIYELFDGLAQHGLEQLHVVNFVNTVQIFMERLNVVKKTVEPVAFPAHLHIDYRVPLPSNIYNYYVNLINKN